MKLKATEFLNIDSGGKYDCPTTFQEKVLKDKMGIPKCSIVGPMKQ